ncbi:hypothetical protein A2U01_0074378, partial [Trifolium medium]|nr:hypothetical protein [Trifolium medium]
MPPSNPNVRTTLAQISAGASGWSVSVRGVSVHGVLPSSSLSVHGGSVDDGGSSSADMFAASFLLCQSGLLEIGR